MFSGGSTSEGKAKIIHSLRGPFKLKDNLAVLEFPKATYIYWQKRFNRTNSDQEIEEIILDIRKRNPNYGYRSICGELRNSGYIINKKKVQRLVQKLGLQVTSFFSWYHITHKMR